jgi:hypothetical protein
MVKNDSNVNVILTDSFPTVQIKSALLSELKRMIADNSSDSKLCRTFLSSRFSDEELSNNTGKQVFDNNQNTMNAFISI